MKRWGLLLALIVVSLSAFPSHHAWRKRQEQKREAAYKSALRSYSEILNPGMTRTDVELNQGFGHDLGTIAANCTKSATDARMNVETAALAN
jgi:hypothetical protein